MGIMVHFLIMGNAGLQSSTVVGAIESCSLGLVRWVAAVALVQVCRGNRLLGIRCYLRG